MRHLTVVAFVEGPTDQDFFPPVLDRSLSECVSRAVEPLVEIALEVSVTPSSSQGRVDALLGAVTRRATGVDAVILHYDGSADPARERRKYYEPLLDRWPQAWPALISLTPVKEMEAWALSDLTVLRGVVGADWEVKKVHEGHHLADPEQLSDPKRTLNDICSFAVRPRRAVDSAHEYLPILGERTSLSSLRKLASFRAFEKELGALFVNLGWSRGLS